MVLLNLVPIIRMMKGKNVCLTCGAEYLFYNKHFQEWIIMKNKHGEILLRTKNVKKAMRKFLN